MSNYTFRNPRPLGLAICTLAVVFGMTVLVSIGGHVQGLLRALLDQPAEGLPRIQGSVRAWFDVERELAHATAWVDLDQALSQVRPLLFVISAVLFLIWLYQAIANLWAIGESTDFPPGWAVGMFFIPLAQCVVPYVVVRDVWVESHLHMEPADHDGHADEVTWQEILSGLFRWPFLPWWVLSIVAFQLATIVPQLLEAHQHTPLARALTHHAIALASLGVLLIALMAFMRIVWRISSLHAGYMQAAQRPDTR
jgi:hypothetical protein